MTPTEFIARRVAELRHAPNFVGIIMQHIADIAIESHSCMAHGDGLELHAIRLGYCDACASEGSTLVGDRDVPCRECKPTPDIMEAAKAHRENA